MADFVFIRVTDLALLGLIAILFCAAAWFDMQIKAIEETIKRLERNLK